MKCFYSVVLYFSLILLMNQTYAKVKKYEKKLTNTTATTTTTATTSSTIPINNKLKLSIKNSKLILEKFKQLPNNDIKFIKELDKQFNIYGDKVKIKITKINSKNITENGKNKRTINGHIGYGYQQNQPSDSYYFSKPKYQIYPYSQHDIKPQHYYNSHQQHHQQSPQQHYYQNQHQYQHQHPTQYSQYKNHMYLPQQQSKLHTIVEIEPSQSYELKETTHGLKLFTSDANGYYYQQSSSEEQHQPHQPQQHQQPDQHQHYEEQVPVIVLRIPGPAKYAAHLQELLQKYLEVRAAEYIKNLQEQQEQENYYPQPQPQPQQHQYEQTHQSQQAHEQHEQQQQQQQPEYRQVNDLDTVTVEVPQHQEKQYWMTEKTIPIVDNSDQYSYQHNSQPENYVTYVQPEQQPSSQHQHSQEQTTYVYDHNVHYVPQENETSQSIQYVYHPIIRHNITYDDDDASVYPQEYSHQSQQQQQHEQSQQPREYSSHQQEPINYYSNYHASTEEPQNQMVYYHQQQHHQQTSDESTYAKPEYYQSLHHQQQQQSQSQSHQDYHHQSQPQYDSHEEIIQITQKSPIMMRLSMTSSPSSTEYNYHAHDAAAIGITPRSSLASSIEHQQQQHETTKLHPATAAAVAPANDQHYYASTKKRTETRVYQAAPVNNNEQEYKDKVQKLMNRMKKKVHQEN